MWQIQIVGEYIVNFPGVADRQLRLERCPGAARARQIVTNPFPGSRRSEAKCNCYTFFMVDPGSESDASQKKAEEDLLRLRAVVLELMSEGVLVTDDEARILFTNQAFDAMFGYEPGELMNQHAAILNADTPEVSARLLGEVQEQLAKKNNWRGEFNSVRKDGTLLTISAEIRAHEVSGKTYWIAVEEDITERKRRDQLEQFRSEREKIEEDVERQMVGSNPYKLTFREFTVLHQAAEGDGDKAIADRLGSSSTTVSKHIGIILKKMSASSRTEACVRALREGFLS